MIRGQKSLHCIFLHKKLNRTGKYKCCVWKRKRNSGSYLYTGQNHNEAISSRGQIFAGPYLRGCNLRGSRLARRIGPIIEYNFYSISRLMKAKKSRNSRGKPRPMETHFYTMDFSFSFTRIFLYTFRKIPYNFFLCPVRISRIMNAKISKFEREDKSNGIPLLHHDFFFLSREFSYEHSERFLTIFFNAVLVFLEE